MSLTPKQEKFIQGIVSGKLSQREAYKQAYNATKMKDETIDKKASILFSKGEIRGRYEQLISEYSKEAIYKRLNAEEDLIWVKEEARNSIIKKGLNQGNGTIYINSVKELCALNNLYPDKKAKDDDKQEKDIAKVLKEALGDL